jgi:hypothetical protein
VRLNKVVVGYPNTSSSPYVFDNMLSYKYRFMQVKLASDLTYLHTRIVNLVNQYSDGKPTLVVSICYIRAFKIIFDHY